MVTGRRFRVLLGATLVSVLFAPAPAAAHQPGIQAAVDYRTRVDALSPAVPGVRVRFVASGSRLELRNSSARTVEVLGYRGEPWLRVRADGVWRNSRSPSAYLDEPASADKAAANADDPPRWQQLSRDPVVRWHDHRAVWHGDPPAAVRADPTRAHRVRDWTIPVTFDGGAAQISGVVDWLPPPGTGPWWALTLLVAAAIAALGLRSATVTRAALAGCALVTGSAAIAFAMVVIAFNAEPTSGGWGTALLSEGLPLLTGLVLIAAGVAVLANRPAADFALTLAGITVALFTGLNNAALFTHAVAPLPIDGGWARLIEVATLGGGLGLAVCAALRIRRAAGEHDGRSGRGPRRPGGSPPDRARGAATAR